MTSGRKFIVIKSQVFILGNNKIAFKRHAGCAPQWV